MLHCCRVAASLRKIARKKTKINLLTVAGLGEVDAEVESLIGRGSGGEQRNFANPLQSEMLVVDTKHDAGTVTMSRFRSCVLLLTLHYL